MSKRFVTIWFRNLVPEWMAIRRTDLQNLPFAFASPDHGRMIITSANHHALSQGIQIGMVVADARAMIPSLQVFDEEPSRAEKLLKAIAEWFIRYAPIVAVDLPDGIILDATGCAHLWGGEQPYLTDIIKRLKKAGYNTRAAMADTIGAAWAITRFGQQSPVIEKGAQLTALFSLPPASLRLSPDILMRLQKLGLHQVGSFINMPRYSLRRRFGPELLNKLDQALGLEEEVIQPVCPVEPYQERLPCLEPIVTATGIEIALRQLLGTICLRLQQEEMGLRSASFKGYRLDGKMELITIGTHCASNNIDHLFKLFEPKIGTIEPALGIELFTIEATKVEAVEPLQQKLWAGSGGLGDIGLSELLDRLTNKFGSDYINRYLPDEHYWPERSIKLAAELEEKSSTPWQERPRPSLLLATPVSIEVTAPVPDYPPIIFRYKNQVHTIKKADGPERIEREWWLEDGPHRDYYIVEDEKGQRYWVFRSGHYNADQQHQWFLHGFFA